eukprot:GILK01002479.1.p1 GENE.GILK01002479.1~~GILK01002479.1.p1  ORF type:complete len:794 (-),score=148.65 GILK01002479.1:161-2542(-)
MSAPAPPGIPPPQFFVDQKKGEVNELRMLLRQVNIERDNQKKRDVIKKVIAYMTLGIDVSRLFSDMIMASSTTDLVQKKMVYLYLVNYADSNPELAILAINTLQKDCLDEDPMVRGLALRSLCSLRLSNIVEYLMPAITRALADRSAYVRKTAVVGCIKLFHIAPQAVKGANMVDTMYNSLRDADTQVITNAIYALNEMLAEEGGMAVNKAIVTHLLNRMRDFTDWGQCAVLELVSKYSPSDDNEMFDIMNILEDRLKHSNSAVVLGCTKVFLNLTRDKPVICRQVYERLKAPLITLMVGGSFELAYTVLSHIELLVQRGAAEVFVPEYKQFFCRYNEPGYMKIQKLDILTSIVTEATLQDIISEMGEYVTDVDADLARRAIRSIGQIAIKIPSGAPGIVKQLISFLDLETDYVSTETVIVMKDLLRKYKDESGEIIHVLERCLRTITEPEGKTAVVWMIGEFGELIHDAPYILEPLINNFMDEQSHIVKMELLTATMKLFFKRPPEVQHMLGRLLRTAINENTHTDVRDRAMLYYRLLTYNVDEANRVINCQKDPIDGFTEQEENEVKEKIFEEFNSLSVTYGQPSDRFITTPAPAATVSSVGRVAGGGEEVVSDEVHRQGEEELHEPLCQSQAPRASHAGGDLLGMDSDLLDLQGAGAHGLAAGSLLESASPSLVLSPNPVLDATEFQTKWVQLPNSGALSRPFRAVNMDASVIERAFAAKNVLCMASGQVDSELKFYFFARQAFSEAVLLVELIINPPQGSATAVVKADDPTLATPFTYILNNTLQQLFD